MTDIPKSEITIHPENIPSSSFVSTNKGLVVAIVIGAILLVTGITTLLSLNSSSKYQGLIQNVQNQTKILETKIEK